MSKKCPTCEGTGWDSAMRQSGLPADTPSMFRPFGIFQCGTCNGRGEIMTKEDLHSAMGKLLSDDPGLAEIKRMEYLMSKAPCLARLDELAAYAAKDDDK